MIIAIDGNEANVKNRVGIGEYAYQLLLQLVKLANLNIMFEVYLKDNPISDMPKESPYWRYKKVGPKKLWTQIGLPIALFSQKKRPDVFFTPSHYAPRFSPVPTAIAVMDLSYIHFPQLFKKRDLYQLVRWTRYSIKHASRVFTISNASKNDIIKYYKIPDERVVVTYPGIKQEKTKSMSGTLKKFGISDKYILFVGTLQPRKNVSRLIEAFSQISPKQKDMQLVLVGKKGWLFEDILSSPQKFGVSDKVVFLDFVSNEDLPALYAHATCFVLPSLYEGFGLPVLEAMKYGCPVITSNVSSLPEAGGDAALYIDPTNVQDIAQKIENVLSDEKLRKTMKEKGLAQIKKFSWEKTAKETLAVLQSMAK